MRLGMATECAGGGGHGSEQMEEEEQRNTRELQLRIETIENNERRHVHKFRRVLMGLTKVASHLKQTRPAN